jgi:hypothetical protein
MDERAAPIWYHDPTDEARYAVAHDAQCPACNKPLYVDNRSSSIAACVWCRRVFYEDGRRVARTWWSGSGSADPGTDEVRSLLVRMLRAARPHPVEHPTMWQVWGDVCVRVGLNPDDFRVPRSP